MIHYTCDRCKSSIDPSEESRYVVQIEVHAVTDPSCDAGDDETDSLSELHQLLEGIESEDDAIGDESTSHRGRYDLCPRCHKQFLRNPLGRESSIAFHFSNN